LNGFTDIIGKEPNGMIIWLRLRPFCRH